MAFALSLIAQMSAGLLAAVVLVAAVPALRLSAPGTSVVGAFGGAILGGMAPHLIGGHHHMAGMAMPAGSMPGGLLPSLASDALAGAAGGCLLLLLAALVCRFVPGK